MFYLSSSRTHSNNILAGFFPISTCCSPKKDIILKNIFVFFYPDDGLIQQSDLRSVMTACMEENGMRFDEKEIEDLAHALYEDAAGLAADQDQDQEEEEEEDGEGGSSAASRGITIEDLKAELAKHDGLLENLSIK